MADESATQAASKGGKAGLGFLTRKIGPAPVYVWVALIVGAYLIYSHFHSSSSGTTAATAIDPTTGLPYSEEAIDPATGVPYSQEFGAAESQLSDNSSASQTTGGQQFSSNDQWATAAINYLVGVGIDPSVATQAIENYLAGNSQPNAQYQADVNTAISALGPPPEIPGPASSNPSPITGQNPPPPTGGGGGGKKPTTATRNVAPGGVSLNTIAKQRNTTASHIVSTTVSSHGTGNGIDSANLAKFNAYVAGGTSKPMPKGLIYYTSNPTVTVNPGGPKK